MSKLEVAYLECAHLPSPTFPCVVLMLVSVVSVLSLKYGDSESRVGGAGEETSRKERKEAMTSGLQRRRKG